MTQFRRGSGRGQFRSPRRTTEWTVGTGDNTVLGPLSSGQAAFVGQGVNPTIPGLTVVRIRGYFQVWLETLTVASSDMFGAFGIGIASLAAFTAGIASLPTPITEEDSENWLYHQYFGITSKLDTLSAGEELASYRVEIDSKAMRKVSQDQVTYAALEIVEIGAVTLVASHNSRQLVKLP